jgi:hypothetical protein
MSSRWLRAKKAVVRLFCAACAALALLWLRDVSATTAHAQAELDLSWQAPAGCPDASWATQRIANHLARDLVSAAGPALRAQVEIQHEEVGFSLRLTTTHANTRGERTLEDARCENLAEAATLLIALAIDANQVLQEQTQPDVPAPSPAAPDREKPPALQAKRALKAVYESPARFRTRLSVMGEAGFLPAPSFGPELTLGVQRARFGAEFGGFWLPKRDSQGAQHVRVSLWALALRGCVQGESSRFRLGGCLGVELGRVSADGIGLMENLQKRALFAALSLPLRARLRLGGPAWLALDLGLAVPFLRPRFVTLDTTAQERTVLHTPEPVSARASLGIELSF